MKLRGIHIVFIIISICSCRELYHPEVLDEDLGIMVVEGFIEVGGGTTVLKLGRTTTVYAEESIKPINKAEVYLHGSKSGSWQLRLVEGGVYELHGNLPEDQEYQLKIHLNDREQYDSEWMKPVVAPPIERIYFEQEDEGVFIYLDSKGAENFFLWTTEETWEFRSYFNAHYKYDPVINDMVVRGENINLCYKEEISNQIILGGTVKGTDGNIKGVEVRRIPPFSEKLGLKYSIEVWQRPLDERAFEFWESLRKNTEDIGDIFSPMPSYLGSNIKLVGSEETPVIGYISAGKSDRKRIFIGFTEVRPWPVRIPDYAHCSVEDTIPPALYNWYFVREDVQPALEIRDEEGRFLGWSYTYTNCVDCRLRGTTEKPEFWD